MSQDVGVPETAAAADHMAQSGTVAAVPIHPRSLDESIALVHDATQDVAVMVEREREEWQARLVREVAEAYERGRADGGGQEWQERLVREVAEGYERGWRDALDAIDDALAGARDLRDARRRLGRLREQQSD